MKAPEWSAGQEYDALAPPCARRERGDQEAEEVVQPFRKVLLLASVLCVAAAVAAVIAMGPAQAGIGGAAPVAADRGQQTQPVSLQLGIEFGTSSEWPFPAGDYQAAVDFLPITTFFDIAEKKPWMPDPITSRLPALLQKFDLRWGLEENLAGWDPVNNSPPEPRTVLCASGGVHKLLDYLEGDSSPIVTPSAGANRTVVFSGTESPLSETFGQDDAERAQTAARLQKFFSRIFYYVTDVSVDGVDTMPLGFTEMYMRGRTDEFLEAFRATRIGDEWKHKHVLAAWGIYTAGGGEHYVYGHHPFADNYGTDSLAWTEVANHAIDMRNDAIGWISTPEGQAAGVDRKTVPKEQWWMELSRYKFIISPLGTAIQCSKVPEALAMLTIPIVKRGPFDTHDDLLRMGFPIVVVENWKEVTEAATATWWKDMSPRLLDFRQHCLNTEGYWRLFTQGTCL